MTRIMAIRRGLSLAMVVVGGSALAVAAAANGAVRAAGAKAPPRQHPASAGTAARSANVVVDVIDLVSPRLGLVGLGVNPAASAGRARLMLTTNFGRTFTDIGPRTARQTEPDSIFFLDRRHGWFATFSLLNLKETVYRTRDGGRHWRAFAAPGHSIADLNGDLLQFTSPRDGWLTDMSANAPAESLFRTTNGGATWHKVASLRPGHHGPGVLPEFGRVEFQPSGTVGWLGGGAFSHALYRTSDGGRTWHRARTSAPAGSAFDLPAIFGRHLIEPITIFGKALLLNVSTDGGRTWRIGAQTGVIGAPCDGPMPTSFASATAGWAAVFHRQHLVAYRSRATRLWAAHTVPAPVPGGLCDPDQIAAAGDSSAWLVTLSHADTTLIYATRDNGKTWHRIDKAALAG